MPAAPEASRGRVWLLADDPRDPELVFDFPFDEDLNDAVRRLPGRWFNWRYKQWRVPADPRLAKLIEAVLGRFPGLEAAPEVVAWLGDSDRWRALASVAAHEGAGAFVLRTLSGEPPDSLAGAATDERGRLVLPFSAEVARRLERLEGVQLDDLARECVRELSAGGAPAPAELTLEIGDDGEPAVTLVTRWDPAPARAFKRLPEARRVARAGRFFTDGAASAVAVPGDAALAPALTGFVDAHPEVELEERVEALLDELVAEHEEASETVALSHADDADLDGLVLGGELHPFQRAGVRYALARRRTFIADEQGLGKTVQALVARRQHISQPRYSMTLTTFQCEHDQIPS